MRIPALYAGLLACLVVPTATIAQENMNADRIVEAFFENRNNAASEASAKCPGNDALSDAVMASLTRPRPEEQTRRLVNAWGYVPPCRVPEILAWSEQASRIIRDGPYAAALARKALALDPVQGLLLLRRAAEDASVSDDARGAYQVAVYSRLSPVEQVDLYIETFSEELQAGLYPHLGLQNVFGGRDPGGTAVRILSAVLEHPNNARAVEVLHRVLGAVVLSPHRFGTTERVSIWSALEPHLDSVPLSLRAAIESYEVELRAGPA